MTSECPLCEVWLREPENVLFESDIFVVMRTKFLKGHRERVMVMCKEHRPNLRSPRQEALGLSILEDVCKDVFDYTHKVVIMEGKFGSLPDHWHVVASDLDPKSYDFYQVLGTPWYKVIHIKDWDGNGIIRPT